MAQARMRFRACPVPVSCLTRFTSRQWESGSVGSRPFRPYAIGGLAVVIGSGLVLALAHLGSPAALVTTSYGLVLVVKAALVAAALLAFPLPRLRGGVGGGA